MKIRILSSREDISSLDKEKLVHFAFRPSYKDIYDVTQACPRVKAIQIPSSYIKTISDSTKLFLDTKGISLLEGDVRHETQIRKLTQTCEKDMLNLLSREKGKRK